MALTQKELKELLDYNPETGEFMWKVDRSDKVKAGDIAGGSNLSNGYKRICINYHTYAQHRLAFLYMTGKFPNKLVDHINGKRSDNRWCNLRQADDAQNACNKAMQSNNKSGHIGIWKPKGRDKFVVQVRGKHVGYCDTLEEAKAVYQREASKQFGNFFRQQEIA